MKMQRLPLLIACLLPATLVTSTALGQNNSPDTVFRSSTNLVVVPALVRTAHGENVFTLTADDFLVTDNGVPQKVSLEPDTDSQPLAMVILVQTGGTGARRLDSYRRLEPTLESVVGAVPHHVALVGFDGAPHLVTDFTPDLNELASGLASLAPGDDGAAILDSLSYAVDMLRHEPPSYRRAILLLSETLDHGSQARLEDALRAISDTNTAIYSLGFSSTRGQMRYEAANFNSDTTPAPPGGCMSKPGAKGAAEKAYAPAAPDADNSTPNQNEPDTDKTAHDNATNDNSKDDNAPKRKNHKRLVQAYDCATLLAPPLLLVKMATDAAINSLHRNVPETVAQLTGGEYYKFENAKNLERGLLTIANHVPNRYVLSFSPQSPQPGLHALDVRLKDRPGLVVTARKDYWAEDKPSEAKPTAGSKRSSGTGDGTGVATPR